MPKYNIIFPALITLLLFLGCRKEDSLKAPKPEVLEAVYSRKDVEDYHSFSLFRENILTVALPEASGIVSGRKNNYAVYIHEDSGNRPVVFVYDTLGNYLGDIVLVGATNRDWEDIAIGPGPVDGETYIYVGDIGDNKSAREYLTIYRFAEPTISSANKKSGFRIEISEFSTIKFRYPDGARDAETLLIDPATKDFIVITKREVNVHVYQLPYPHSTNGFTNIYFRGQLPLKTIVGGDISPNGKELLLKNYGEVYHWYVNGDVVRTLFDDSPVTIEYIPEVKGEAIGWTSTGDGYFTTTETEKHAADPILYHYKRSQTSSFKNEKTPNL